MPFCAHKCEYCAFYSEASSGDIVGRYVSALVREIELVASDLRPRTVFFGGGTPSILNLRQWEQVLAYLDCTAAPQSDFEPTTTLRRIGRDVISVSLFASYFCGGAHPDFGDSPFNLDPRTGRELALEDVFWLGKGTPPLYDAKGASQPWFDYRGEVFGSWVAARMVALYPKQAKPAAPGDDADACDYGDPGVWSYANWYATPKGLHVSATFARVMRVCDDPDWSVIPWADVRRHPGKVKLAP